MTEYPDTLTIAPNNISKGLNMTASELFDKMKVREDCTDYERNCMQTANTMIANGFGNWVYSTQWTSGSCLYHSPISEQSVIIPVDGREIRWP